MVGAAWVLRDVNGLVLCHSRTTFVGCHLKDEAKLITILWAVESMTSQRVKNVIFKGEFKEFFEAINKPGAWPAFSFQGMEVMTALSGCQGWLVNTVHKDANR